MLKTTALTRLAIDALGLLNVSVYRLSGGRVVLYRFRPQSYLTLNLPADAESGLPTVSVPYAKDRDDYVILWDERCERSGVSLSQIADAVRMEIEVNGSVFEAEHAGLGDAEECKNLLARVRKHVSWTSRYEMDKQQQFPIARLRKTT
ncbi:hypothetical protein [Nonomuraea typhae]|uniref:Uncharacterized protein n=1 Tax=Nonomuraea typhae TaxID=2603600 RepID=A0ABW7YPJ8_9ACTN